MSEQPDQDMETWNKLPLELMDEFAERESYSRRHYRPVYSMHKWWARRPGSTFRMLGLAHLTDGTTTKDNILKRNESGSYSGRYLQNNSDEFEDTTILDPFMGGGTSIVELNRLGADTIGYELNPVAWWTTKKIIDDVNLDKLRSGFETVIQNVREEVGDYYKTVDRDTGRECDILYSFQSQQLSCPICSETVSLFPRYILRNKRKTTPAVIYCPNDECESRIIELNREIEETETCPSCDTEFDPRDGSYGYGKYTCSNGHKHDVKETLQRLDEAPKFKYFALHYRGANGEKKFKEPDIEDQQKIQSIRSYYDTHEDELLIPDQRIPVGDETNRIVNNYNYKHFKELFTRRHRVTFAKLFEYAQKLDDKAVSEAIVTTISSTLNYNSKLCKWNTRNGGYGGDTFARHAYIPRVQPVEGNPLAEEGLASLHNFFKNKTLAAKEYGKSPYEKVKNTKTGEVKTHEIIGESVSENRSKTLKSKTSENLDEDDESVDYIITDPPYYDNVQYSELSDYFYVWLREVLKDDYEEFQPEHVPKAREIVANNKAGKDEEFFVEALTSVFSEANRVLKPDGEMVFTYHHNENEAWSVILEALIKSGFTVTGAYPVQSEMPTNPHISDLDNAEYDILIFANKDDIDEEITLSELEQELFFDLDDIISDEQQRHQNLSRADLGVILRGKCMYYYSRYYPNITDDGEQVTVTEALEAVDDLIEQSLQGAALVPQSLDAPTEAYAAFVRRESEDYSTLNKNLLAKNLSVADLEDEHLVDGPREEKRPVPSEERVYHIEQKLNGNGAESTNGGGTLLAIDKLHYLYHLYITDQNAVEYLREWTSDDLEDLAEFMADETGDERYERALETSLSQF
jgi:putative DNA methylase